MQKRLRAIVVAIIMIMPSVGTVRAEATFPLGSLGGEGIAPTGRKYIQITSLVAGAPGEVAGLRVDDQIKGLNGKPFEAEFENFDNAGQGPLEALGNAIDESEGKDGKLTLNGLRGSNAIEIKVQLKPVGSFGPTYPFNSPKSREYYDRLCKYIAAQQKRDGYWPGITSGSFGVTSSICALALMARADGKYRKNVDLFANAAIDHVNHGDFKPNSSWNEEICYLGIFLGEYYWATHDARVPPALKSIVETLVKRQGELGNFGHGALPVTYGGNGLTLCGSLVFWCWSMARKCGVEVPDENYNKLEKYLHTTAGKSRDGKEEWIGYNHTTCDLGQFACRTGNTAMALIVSGDDPKWAERLAKALANHTSLTLECHAVSTLGMVSSCPAQLMLNPTGYRKHMDFWRWYFTLSRGPGENASYIGGRGNTGGDDYLNKPVIMSGVVALALAAPDSNLYMYGKFLNIDGVSYFNLQPKLKSVYDDFMTRKYSKSAIEYLQHQTSKDVSEKTPGALSYEDRETAGRMLAYLHKQVIEPSLGTVQAAIGAGDMFAAKVRLTNLEKTYAPAIFDNDTYKNQMAVLTKPENQALVETGFRYYSLALRIEHARDPKSRLYVTKELIAKELDKLRTEFAGNATSSIYKTLAHGKVAAPDSNPVPAELLDNGHVYSFKDLAGKATGSEAVAKSTEDTSDEKSWDSKLIARLKLYLQEGKKPMFEKDGMENKVQIMGIDSNDRVRLSNDSSDFFLAFNKLSIKDKTNLVLELANKSLKEDCELARHFLIACGRTKKAEEFDVPTNRL